MKFVASGLNPKFKFIYDVMIIHLVPGYPDYDVL